MQVKEFYDRGSLHVVGAQRQTTDWTTQTRRSPGYLYNNGLSPLGKQVIAEMNRLGMMINFEGYGDCISFRGAGIR